MSKYGNKWTVCLSRHNHQSRAEANYCNRLLAMKQNGEISNFITQADFEVGPGIHHRVDFLVWKYGENAPREVHEIKGFQTPEWKIKRKLFIAKYPEINYITIELRGRRKSWFKKAIRMKKKIRRIGRPAYHLRYLSKKS